MLAHFIINRKAPEHEDFKTKLKIRLDANRMLEFESASSVSDIPMDSGPIT